MNCTSVQFVHKGAGFYFTRMVLFHSQGSISLAGFYFTRRVLFHSQGSISLAGFYFTCMVLFHLKGSISLARFYLNCMILIHSYGSILALWKKFPTSQVAVRQRQAHCHLWPCRDFFLLFLDDMCAKNVRLHLWIVLMDYSMEFLAWKMVLQAKTS